MACCWPGAGIGDRQLSGALRVVSRQVTSKHLALLAEMRPLRFPVPRNSSLRVATPVRRSRQRGYAEGLVPLMTLLVYGLLGLLLIAFIASFLLPIAWLKGRWRIAALLCVVGFWGHLYFKNVTAPEEDRTWRRAGWARCEVEQEQLPSSIVVDGFLDEGAALRTRVLYALFAERHLDFIEVKVPQSGADAGRIAYPDGDGESGWFLPSSKGSYVRLQLGKKGDPACVDLPYGLSDRMDRPPFLPDTCIAATYSNAPTARYALSLGTGASRDTRQYGSWVLLDRTTGQPIVRLTTTDTPGRVSSAGLGLSLPARPLVGDCRSPHTIIVDRLIGSDSARQTQLLLVERVDAKPDVTSIDQAASNMPLVRAISEPFLYSEAEEGSLFAPEIRQSEWKLAIEQAFSAGYADYGSTLVDLRARRLISLAPTSRANSYPWQVFAVGEAFLVVSTSPGWYETSSNLMALYSRDGRLLWAVHVEKPGPADIQCTHWWPQAAYITTTDLVLADRCIKLTPDEARALGKDGRGEIWKIPLRSLPGKL